MAEWSIAPVLKTDVPRGTGGSNPSLSAERKADRNSNLFEGLSAFSFCKDARGSARDGQSQSLPLRKKKEAKASFFALEGMRTPEWGFVIDEVACQSKNPSLSARKRKLRLPFLH